MRSVATIAVCLVVGCSDASHTPVSPSSPAALMTRSAPTPVREKLYSDAEIRELASFDIDEQEEQYGSLRLDVVPHGEAYPREKVFKALGIEEGRLLGFRWYWSFHVVFLIWQVSPSYDIECMTAINDPENEGLKMADPRRKVYGIRLRRHSEWHAE